VKNLDSHTHTHENARTHTIVRSPYVSSALLNSPSSPNEVRVDLVAFLNLRRDNRGKVSLQAVVKTYNTWGLTLGRYELELGVTKSLYQSYKLIVQRVSNRRKYVSNFFWVKSHTIKKYSVPSDLSVRHIGRLQIQKQWHGNRTHLCSAFLSRVQVVLRHDSAAHYVTTLSPTHLLRTNCDLDPILCSTNVAAKQWDVECNSEGSHTSVQLPLTSWPIK
jgi:hypothetical protein